MIYINLGRREQGKTTLAAFLAQQSKAPLVVIFDPRGLFPSSERAQDSTTIDAAFGRAEEQRHGRIVVTPEFRLQEAFDQTCREVKLWLQVPDAPKVAFIVDEARMIDAKAPAFDWLLRCASRESATIVLTAHRPKDVPVDARAIADVWCVFPTTQAHDYEVFEDQFNVAAVNAIRRLKDRQFLAWDDTTATFRIYEDPALWYVPLGGAAGAVSSRRDPLPEGGRAVDPKRDLFD